ncbi:MAG: hypothetical protein KIT72_15860 [Polyangiaceae bacterium]|nr:hypothetical protein [Polyangiaceae bacterium]MCW5791892.1 hypothetical protein [Polyangiaceae bacterium]
MSVSRSGLGGLAWRWVLGSAVCLTALSACERTPEVKPEDCYRLCGRFEACASRAELAECAAGCSAWQRRALEAGAQAELAAVLGCVERDLAATSTPCERGAPHQALVQGRRGDPCSAERAALTRRLDRCQPGTVSFRQLGEASVELTQLGCGSVRCDQGPDAGAPGAACSAPSVCSPLCCDCDEVTGRRSARGSQPRGTQVRVRGCEAGRCVSQERACQLLREAGACPAP